MGVFYELIGVLAPLTAIVSAVLAALYSASWMLEGESVARAEYRWRSAVWTVILLLSVLVVLLFVTEAKYV